MHLVSRLRRVSAVVIVLLGLLAGLGAAGRPGAAAKHPPGGGGGPPPPRPPPPPPLSPNTPRSRECVVGTH